MSDTQSGGSADAPRPARKKREREPLGFSCKTVKCDQGFHCFLDPPKTGTKTKQPSAPTSGSVQSARVDREGVAPVATEAVQQSSRDVRALEGEKKRCCWACGADLIDWDRVHRLDLDDASSTFASLKIEYIRHHFWHVEIDQHAVNHALRKGVDGLRVATEKRIRQAVGEGVHPDEPTFDGRQTPLAGNVIFYAQHATSTCCRKCMEVWHGIPQTEDLTDRHVEYFTEIVMLFVQDRLPSLGKQGIKVPPIRKPKEQGHSHGQDVTQQRQQGIGKPK